MDDARRDYAKRLRRLGGIPARHGKPETIQVLGRSWRPARRTGKWLPTAQLPGTADTGTARSILRMGAADT